MKDLGFTGLQTQDSLGITRARLAKQRLNENMSLINQIKDMEVRVLSCFKRKETQKVVKGRACSGAQEAYHLYNNMDFPLFFTYQIVNAGGFSCFQQV